MNGFNGTFFCYVYSGIRLISSKSSKHNLGRSYLNKVLRAAEGNQLGQNALDEITQLNPTVLYHPDIYPALWLCYFYLNFTKLLKYIGISKKLLPILR